MAVKTNSKTIKNAGNNPSGLIKKSGNVKGTKLPNGGCPRGSKKMKSY